MKHLVLIITAVTSLGLTPLAVADERPEHFEGKSAETLEQAVANFSEYNNKLEGLLARDELGAAELHEVHQLTYTLENALGRINKELEELEDTLEDVHLASERADAETVQRQGRIYLDTARTVIE
ncbi:MAG: DUF6746 family protein [Gammaproteobacteria bacterium]|nr:DUF6746 family protein [Gammaproteobacteria bacterium]